MGDDKKMAAGVETSELVSTIESFQHATGLSVCFKLFDSHLSTNAALVDALEIYRLHETSFCRDVKKTRNEACKECDLRKVPERCEAEKKLFAHTCHAGGDEVIIPLVLDEELAGIVYVGQFRQSPDQAAELPLLNSTAMHRLLALARMLGAYLTNQLKQPDALGENYRNFRKQAIRSFLVRRLRHNPGLPDLAGFLGLSVTRTAHVVKELYGSSFVELKDQVRLSRACLLLNSTYHKIAWVAEECGFSSSQHFHKFFRQKTGSTPNAYRTERRPEV